MEMFIWVAVIVGIAAIVLMAAISAARADLKKKAMAWMDEIGIHEYRTAFRPGDAIGIDYEKERIAISAEGKNCIVPFDKVVSVEVQEDGVTTNKTNRGSQLLGAAVGAAALGGVGAIIGGLSGSSTSKERISKATINIITSLPEFPYIQVKVFHEQPVDRSGFIYSQLTAELMPWYGRLKAILETR